MDLELKIKEIKDHFKNISEEEFEQKLIEHGIEEIKPMSDLDVSFYGHKRYSSKSIYDEMDTESLTFDVSNGLFNEVA